MGLVDSGDASLALSVVAQRRGLDDRRETLLDSEGGEIGVGLKSCPRSGLDTNAVEEGLFENAVPSDLKHVPTGPHWHLCVERVERVAWHVFELESDHVDRIG